MPGARSITKSASPGSLRRPRETPPATARRSRVAPFPTAQDLRATPRRRCRSAFGAPPSRRLQNSVSTAPGSTYVTAMPSPRVRARDGSRPRASRPWRAVGAESRTGTRARPEPTKTAGRASRAARQRRAQSRSGASTCTSQLLRRWRRRSARAIGPRSRSPRCSPARRCGRTARAQRRRCASARRRRAHVGREGRDLAGKARRREGELRRAAAPGARPRTRVPLGRRPSASARPMPLDAPVRIIDGRSVTPAPRRGRRSTPRTCAPSTRAALRSRYPPSSPPRRSERPFAPLARERRERLGDRFERAVGAHDAEAQFVRRAIERRLRGERLGVIGPAPPIGAQRAAGVQALQYRLRVRRHLAVVEAVEAQRRRTGRRARWVAELREDERLARKVGRERREKRHGVARRAARARTRCRRNSRASSPDPTARRSTTAGCCGRT